MCLIFAVNTNYHVSYHAVAFMAVLLVLVVVVIVYTRKKMLQRGAKGTLNPLHGMLFTGN